MTDVVVLGIDPGFASVGLAVVTLPPAGAEVVEDFRLIRTQKSDKKRGVRASDDNLQRAREIFIALRETISARGVKVLCAESMSFPRNAGNAAKMAMCWGILSALSEQFNLPIVQASPQEVKKVVCAKKDASKEEVQLALQARYAPGHLVSLTTRAEIPDGKIEHPYDALGAVVACLSSEVIRMARRLAG